MIQTLLLILSMLVPPPVDAPPAPSRSIRVAVIGDGSCLASDREYPFDSWPQQLGRMLGERSEVVNCSRAGNRLTPEARQYILEMPEFREAEDARADVVVVALGASDLAVSGGGEPASLRDGLHRMLEAMKGFRPEPKIFLCIPPVSVGGPRIDDFRRGLAQAAPVFVEVARERDLVLIDLRRSIQGTESTSKGVPSLGFEASNRIAADVFRAITGGEPPAGAGPYRDSFDPASYERIDLVRDGVAKVPVPEGWKVGDGDQAGMLVGEPGAEPMRLEGAIPEGPFRMRWRLRWIAGPSMGERGGPQFGAGGNWLSLDNKNASLQIAGPEVRGAPELPATARVAPQETMLEVELRRSEGVLDWRIDGRSVFAAPISSRALANAGLHPMGGRVELVLWTLDRPKP